MLIDGGVPKILGDNKFGANVLTHVLLMCFHFQLLIKRKHFKVGLTYIRVELIVGNWEEYEVRTTVMLSPHVPLDKSLFAIACPGY